MLAVSPSVERRVGILAAAGDRGHDDFVSRGIGHCNKNITVHGRGITRLIGGGPVRALPPRRPERGSRAQGAASTRMVHATSSPGELVRSFDPEGSRRI